MAKLVLSRRRVDDGECAERTVYVEQGVRVGAQEEPWGHPAIGPDPHEPRITTNDPELPRGRDDGMGVSAGTRGGQQDQLDPRGLDRLQRRPQALICPAEGLSPQNGWIANTNLRVPNNVTKEKMAYDVWGGMASRNTGEMVKKNQAQVENTLKTWFCTTWTPCAWQLAAKDIEKVMPYASSLA